MPGQPLGHVASTPGRSSTSTWMYVGDRKSPGGMRSSVRQHASFFEEAGPGRADDAHHVGDHRRGGLDPACARPGERDLPDRVPLDHDGVEGTFDRRERMMAVDERGTNTDVDALVDQRRRADEPHDRVGRTRRGHVLRRDLLDPAVVDVVERDA